MKEIESIAAIPAAADELARKLGMKVKKWGCYPSIPGWHVDVIFDSEKTDLSIFGFGFYLTINDKSVKVDIPEMEEYDYSDGIYTYALSVIKLVTKYVK